MWIFTRAGFFSAVAKGPRKSPIVVRARFKDDLVRLQGFCPAANPIVEENNTDYPYRVYLTRKQWADACTKMAEGVDYENFKSMIAKEPGQGPDRSHLYGGVWNVMYDAERRLARKGGR